MFFNNLINNYCSRVYVSQLMCPLFLFTVDMLIHFLFLIAHWLIAALRVSIRNGMYACVVCRLCVSFVSRPFAFV